MANCTVGSLCSAFLRIKIRKVKIVSCSNPFAWYSSLLKSKDDKVFEVELKLTKDGFYRTIEDVAGPGVKGLINPKDTEVV